MIRAVACDVDNTLTDTISWLKITEALGVSVQAHTNIFDKFLRNRLSYENAKSQLIQLWQSSGKANKPYFEALFADWQFRSDATELIDCLLSKGYVTALITGSVDLFAETVARKLGVPYWYANTVLMWDEAGELADLVYVKDQAALKLKQLQEFAQTVGVSLQECLVIADGDNDIETFRATGNGIAVGSAHPALLKVARRQVDTLHEAVVLLERGEF